MIIRKCDKCKREIDLRLDLRYIRCREDCEWSLSPRGPQFELCKSCYDEAIKFIKGEN